MNIFIYQTYYQTVYTGTKSSARNIYYKGRILIKSTITHSKTTDKYKYKDYSYRIVNPSSISRISSRVHGLFLHTET